MALPTVVPRGGGSLLRRLATSYALLVLLILVTGASGAVALTVSLQASDRVVHGLVPVRDADAAVLLDLTTMQSGVRGYLYSGDVRLLEPVRRTRTGWGADRAALLALTRGTPWERRAGRELRLAHEWVVEFVDPVLSASRQPGGLEHTRRTRDVVASRAAFGLFHDEAERLDAALRGESVQLEARSTSVRRLALLVLLVVAAASAVIGSVAAVSTAADVVGPLSRLRRTVEALTAGHDPRADEESGPAEVRAVAGAMNALSDERSRTRAADDDRVRARRVAHDVGLRIRERIDVAEVEAVAVEELGSAFGVDRVLLRRIEDGRLGPVTRQWRELDVPDLDRDQLRRLSLAGTALQARALWGDVAVLAGAVADDGTLPDDEDVADVLVACDAVSCVVVAFGAGRETLGTLTLVQQRQVRRWSDAELVALESIAADLGRSLQHALLYDRERSLVERLRELDRTKTDFLSTVSHELRTPLTSITGYIELLRDGAAALDPSASRMLGVIERNSYRLNALIEDLLTLSRIESGGARAQRVPVDVASLVGNACADIRPGAVDAGLRLDVTTGPAVWVPGDPGQLDRVLLNLLSNAVKFTPPGGRVAVTWAVEPAGEVVVTVEDTGIGIPQAEAHQLASRFFRASNAMDAAIPGTGLGLSIVRGILELHDGSLAVESSTGGTRVSVRLPGARRPAAAGGTGGAAARL